MKYKIKYIISGFINACVKCVLVYFLNKPLNFFNYSDLEIFYNLTKAMQRKARILGPRETIC